MTVPYTFANQTGTIPLAELDANFAAIPNVANVAGTVTANAQPNITSVGTLTSLSVTGTTSTNLIFQRAPIISLGANAGFSSGIDFIAIGNAAGGNNNQRSYTIAIGSQAGFNNQGNNAISIGQLAGNSSQGSDAIALGQLAGTFNQSANSISIGYSAGKISQGGNAIAIGNLAGNNTQSINAVAIGHHAGFNNQGDSAIAIGRWAGNTTQGTLAVAIGRNAANITQGLEAVAIGHSAGNLDQGPYAVAIGAFAGNNNQGSNSVAIGSFAGYPTVANNAIVINGATSPLDAPNSGLYIAPIRNNNSSNIVFYNTTTKEITYSTAYGNANVAAYLPTYTGNVTANYFIGNGSQLTGISAGNIVGGYGNSNVANYLPTYTGNLTSLNTITATGNIAGNYFIGNGSQLTGISGGGGSNISNGNTNINIASSGSNISFTVGNTQSATFFTSGMSLPGNVTTGNVNASYISVTGNVFANNFLGGGAGSPTVSATTNLLLSAGVSVQVTGGGTFRLPSLTTAAIANLIPVNGDMIYNSSLNKFQGYENGAWGNLI